jgi:hypothetical protein
MGMIEIYSSYVYWTVAKLIYSTYLIPHFNKERFLFLTRLLGAEAFDFCYKYQIRA